MAVIATYVTKRGVTVRVCDDCMARRGTPEYDRIVDEQRRAAYNILTREAARNGTAG